MKKNILASLLVGIPSLFIGGGFLYAQIGTIDTTSPSLTTTTTDTSDATSSAGTSDTVTSLNTTTSGVVIATDTIPPVIKLNGEAVVYLKTGGLYVELGAVAYDNLDGDISPRIIHESNLNITVPGVYRIIYVVRDKAGNIAKAVRTIYVIKPPTITTQTTPEPPPEPAKTESTTTNTTVPTTYIQRDSIEAQTDRLLEILKQGNIQRIEESGRRIIRNATSSSGILHNPQATSTSLTEIHQAIEESHEKIQEKIQKVLERTQKIPDEVRMDSDRDGVSNYDEVYIYGTDPQSADSDGDGYSDRAEITTGFDPKNPDLQAAITYENPKDSGEVKKDILTVATINVAETKTEGEKQVVSKVSFKGKGLPNSFVTVFIFSTPTVITVKTDEEGNWEYVLDKELADGNHEMYVAMTDNAGKILAKSTAIPFIKEANAITVDQNFLTPISKGKSPGLLWGEYMYAAVTVVLSIIGIIFAIIGMRAQPYYRRYKDNPDADNGTGDSNNHA